ncbi:MAG: O-antigen ligase family protein [Solirubrobacterales bacterium]
MEAAVFRSSEPPPGDAWPRTRRPLPWLIAGFLAAIFLLPIDAIHPKISLPFSSDFDRFFVALIVATWALGGLINRNAPKVTRLRSRGWAAGMIAFLLVAVASIAFNVDRITNLGEWDVAQKRLAVLVGLAAVFAIVSLTLRVTELRSFAALVVILATLTALGTIYEKETGYNVFYDTASKVFSPVANVDPSPTEIDPDEDRGRPTITGPTRHGLSVTSILSMALPFAVVLAAIATSGRRRLLWALAACIIVTGALVTQRKSGTVIPAFVLLALFALRPRQLLRLAPFGIVALALAFAVAPGIFSSLQEFGRADSRTSTAGRTSDYPAIVPDLLSNPLLGRGYGTLDSAKSNTYRILDNEYLGQVYQVGILGLIAFLAMIVTPLFVVRSVLRSDHPMRGPPALAAGAGCLAFGVACVLYDILSFPQAPYLFLFMAAMCVCAASVEVADPEPAELAPELRRVLATS